MPERVHRLRHTPGSTPDREVTVEHELHAIHVHLWGLTGLFALILVALGACNLLRQTEDREYRSMKALHETGRHRELLEYVDERLRDAPAAAMPLLYRTMALLALERYEDARNSALKFRDAAPNMRNEALSLLAPVDERASVAPDHR